MTERSLQKEMRGGASPKTAFVADLDAYDDIARTVCAFMNSEGGTIFCGLDERGRFIDSTTLADARAIQLELRLQRDISPSPFVTLTEIDSEDQRALVIDVPVGRDRPYALEGAIYVRSGKSTKAADTYAIREMIQQRVVEAERWERRPSSVLELEDLDQNEIRTMAQSATRANRIQFRDSGDNLEILREIGMFGPSGLTNGADVAFGEDPARRHPQCLARVVRYTTDKGGRTYQNDRQFSGPIVRVLEQLFEAVSAMVSIRARFRPEDAHREDQAEYAFDAIREGITNALAHRDYATFSGGMTVSIYPKRIEIWNSGQLPDGLEAKILAKTHISLPVNPDITRVLYLRTLMERLGRGTERIATACRSIGAKPPRWVEDKHGVTLTLYAAPFREFGTSRLNDRQGALVARLGVGESITPAEYRQHFAEDISERQARRDLTALADDGWLVQESGGATSSYRRTDLMRPNRT